MSFIPPRPSKTIANGCVMCFDLAMRDLLFYKCNNDAVEWKCQGSKCMSVDVEILKTQQVEDFDLLLGLLEDVSFAEKDVLIEIEKQAYSLLRKVGSDINGLVVIGLVQLMLGRREKALAIVYNIWDEGGDFSEKADLVYINLLLDLGLFTMAEMVLKQLFDEMEEGVEPYEDVMFKYAILQGDLRRLEKLLNYVPNKALEVIVKDIAKKGLAEEFKKLMHTLAKAVKDSVCFYEYEVKKEIELRIYVNDDLDFSDFGEVFGVKYDVRKLT